MREPFEQLLEPGRDLALWTYVWSMSLALPALSTIAPDSDLLEVLARALEDAAVRNSRGRILYWTRLSRHADDDAEPSPAHTARVLLAMQHCRKSDLKVAADGRWRPDSPSRLLDRLLS